MKTKNINLLLSHSIACVFIIYLLLHLLSTNSSTSNGFDTFSPTIDSKQSYHNIEECSCSRRFMYPPPRTSRAPGPTSRNFYRLNSSCSDEGTWYQADQKAITFSLFVNEHQKKKLERFYREGLKHNLKMMQKLYPGYSLRLYTNLSLNPENPYCKILCSNPDFFWCNVKVTPSHGDLSGTVFRTWRFLVLGDPTVDMFLSRDLDSLISAREVAVVKEWLSKGDKAISLMRDRIHGHNKPILAGMWQASNSMLGMGNASGLREKIIKLSKMKREHTYKSSDQEILNKVVFYPLAKVIVAYDSFNCIKWANFTEVRPFPTQRGDPRRDFVGNRVNFLNGAALFYYPKDICSVECRPKYGKHWIHC